jgi:Uma2 family endonuclease
VLSSSAEARDLLDKRIGYQFLPSLLEHVVIRQDKMEMRTYRRLDDGWESDTCATGDVPHLSSIGRDVRV